MAVEQPSNSAPRQEEARLKRCCIALGRQRTVRRLPSLSVQMYPCLAREPTSESWRHQRLFTFTQGISGTIPSSGVTIADNRRLFGTTSSSGLSGYSTAYELSLPVRNGQLTLTTLQTFGTGLDSNQARGGLVRGKDGAFYGATSGDAGGNGFVFKIAP